jgi:phosphoadenosine phosphosulfate reductase
MAEPARAIDTIDVAPPFTAADAAALQIRFAGVSAQAMLRELLTGELAGRAASVSSYGAESAVLLHMVAEIDKDVPVIFTNTQKMFGETLAYRDELSERLGLTDLRVFRPDPRRLALKDATGMRPMAVAKFARSSRCGGRWRRSMRGFRGARASRPAPAPRCRDSRRTKGG